MCIVKRTEKHNLDNLVVVWQAQDGPLSFEKELLVDPAAASTALENTASTLISYF